MKQTLYGKHPSLPLYISIDGDVRRSKSSTNKRIPKWHVYATHTTHNGYSRITTRTNGKISQPRIHRLVYETFIGKIENEIDHVNALKTDNRLENLQDLTKAENTRKTHLSYSRKLIASIRMEMLKYKAPATYGYLYYRGYRDKIANSLGIDRNTVAKISKYIARGGYDGI